ncbi:hypothetical protein MJO28_009172 [Puccinia striiformis f. sp. tritici]|uniref:Uncharacterized protein n=1 Tax=Puccinia striiformis f. sp. tritici TaxID=168172 RepID=A0ACC0E6H1_9BASI|nr:hypothetical protein MJO29_016804 [Puccinia striiformis f. sp. tritici]KAI7947264.1 hypothetical protein MJO28_009172 [Puccinia striiformis f. sp. tritici]
MADQLGPKLCRVSANGSSIQLVGLCTCHFSPSTPKSATKRRKGGARADKIHNETNSIISRVSTPPRQPHGNKGRIGSSTGTTIADLSILSRITAPPLTTRDSQLNHEQQSSS